MKKKVIGFAVFGTLLAIVGGIGVAINFPQAEKQSRTAIDERYQVKKNNKKLEIALQGDIRYHISPSKDQDIHINGEAHSVTTEQQFAWKPSESGDKTIIDVSFTETGQYADYIQLGFSQYVNIAVPTSFESITINSTKDSAVTIEGLKTSELVFSSDSHDYSSLQNLRLDNLTVHAQAGSLSLSDIIAQEAIAVTGDQGSFSIDDSRAKTFDIQSDNGYLHLNDLIGNSHVVTEGGFVTLSDLKGQTSVTTVDGDVDWEYSKINDDLTVKTTSGDIRVNLERQPTNFSITTKNTNGTVRLFGKEKKSLKQGTGGPSLTLESLHGDIRVYDEDSEYDDYDETFDEIESDVIDALEENL